MMILIINNYNAMFNTPDAGDLADKIIIFGLVNYLIVTSIKKLWQPMPTGYRILRKSYRI